MKIIGLTGSIGMGKSTLANQCRTLGIPVHDADKTVHDLMRPNGVAFNSVADAFPDVIENSQINRKALGKIVFHDTDKRHILESIIHPLVRTSSNRFIAQCRRRRCHVCVLDIPLLFETGRNTDMDMVMCVTAPKWVQKRRVLSRKNMTKDKFKAILKSQIPDHQKRYLSDIVIQSGLGYRHSLNQLRRIKSQGFL